MNLELIENLIDLLEDLEVIDGEQARDICAYCHGEYDGQPRKRAKIVHCNDCKLKACLEELKEVKSAFS